MADVEKAGSAGLVYKEIQRIRGYRDTCETNFYGNKEQLEQWIQRGRLYQYTGQKVYLLLRKGRHSYQLYYFSGCDDALLEAIGHIKEKLDSINIDFLGKENGKGPLFEKAGFRYYITLHRMTRVQAGGADEEPSYGGYAKAADAPEIQKILEETMDITSDQVPEVPEIIEYINRRACITARDAGTGEIASCILWTRKGSGMVWNYWALNPRFKGTAYGLLLLDAYIKMNGRVNRTSLFVRDHNPAAGIYERIGFRYDGLKDYVFIYRKGEE